MRAKNRILIAVLMFCYANVFGQLSPVNFCNGNEYSVLRLYKSDSLVIRCDTAYLINSSTYKLYSDVFKNQRTANLDIKRLSLLYDQSKNLYENRINQQNQEYEKLKNDFDLLLRRSTDFASQTTVQLSSVNTSLTNIDQSINKANSNMEDASKLIRAEVKTSKRQKLKASLGGFVIGIATCSLAILVFD